MSVDMSDFIQILSNNNGHNLIMTEIKICLHLKLTMKYILKSAPTQAQKSYYKVFPKEDFTASKLCVWHLREQKYPYLKQL